MASINSTLTGGFIPIFPIPPLHPSVQDLTNRDFEYWTVLGYAGTYKGQPHWFVKCQCGTERVTEGRRILNGRSKSCGCRRHIVPYNATHGCSKKAGYYSYHGMIERCYVPERDTYVNYGARGIQVCNRWHFGENNSAGIICFFEDMGERPSPELSLDRINNEGHYSCGHCEHCLQNGWVMNCHWATIHEQNNNRRSNVFYTFEDRTQTIAQWAREYNLRMDTLWRRLKAGWSLDNALNCPISKGNGSRSAQYKI